MLLPESMSRIVVAGTKSRMEDAIEAFYSVGSLHVIDHTTGDDGLSIGSPTPSTSKASERLLKVRAMEKELGITNKTSTADVAVEDVRKQISAGDVESVEREVLEAVDARNDLTQKITELNARKQNLETLERLSLPLDLYSGYNSLAVLVGTTVADPTALSIEGAEVFADYRKKKGGVVAVFVRKESAGNAAAALADYGFAEIQVPQGPKGLTPAEALKKVDADIAAATERLEAANTSLDALRSKHMSFLKGTDEELAIEVEKGSVPLRVAVSRYSYVVDAWVPTAKVDAVKAGLEQKLGDDVYVEFQETRGRKLADSEAAEPRFSKVPTRQKNGKIVSEFEYATSLVSIPRYQEIDPTVLIAIFLPLFFGYMVGDLGYAIPFIILGAYGLKKTRHKDWRSIALALFFGGIWAAIFGLFFYGEFLGMHFIGGHYDDVGAWHWHEDSVALGGTSVTWDWIFGQQFPEWFANMMPSFDHAARTHHGVGKLMEVGFLLKLAVYIGIVHLAIGYLCGFYNHMIQENGREAFFAKGGLIISFFGMIAFCYALTNAMMASGGADWGLLTDGGATCVVFILSIILLAIGTGIGIKGEGAMGAIMALPEFLGQILSYTRLAAIAMSKAGMALAFNYICIGMILPTMAVIDAAGDKITVLDPTANIALTIIGILLLAFLHLVIWTLAILSGGLHALRLQFVELMTRFFDGNGIAFSPLREIRKKTFFSSKNANIDTQEV